MSHLPIGKKINLNGEGQNKSSLRNWGKFYRLGKREMVIDRKETIIYTGPSMNPTLKAPDVILLEPLGSQGVCAGDVIVWRLPGSERNIIHRVVGVDEKGIRTQGDNNGSPDPWTLPLGAVLGKVDAVLRGRRRKNVYGGLGGRIYAVMIRAFNRARRFGFSGLWPVYRCFFLTGPLGFFFNLKKYMRFITIERPAGQEMQLLIRGSVAGRRLPGEDHWCIRRRYLPFVDEVDLPQGDDHAAAAKHF